MTVVIYIAVMSLLVTLFLLAVALLKSVDSREQKKKKRKNKYNLKK